MLGNSYKQRRKSKDNLAENQGNPTQYTYLYIYRWFGCQKEQGQVGN